MRRSRNWRANNPLGRDAGARFLEQHASAAVIDADAVLGGEAAFEDRFRQRVLDLGLDGALQLPRPVHRVEADLGELAQNCVGHLQPEVQLDKSFLHYPQLDAPNWL